MCRSMTSSWSCEQIARQKWVGFPPPLAPSPQPSYFNDVNLQRGPMWSAQNDELTQGIVEAIQTVPAPQPISVSLKPADLPVGVAFAPAPAVVPTVGPGGTATFNVTLTVNSVPFLGAFDASFVDMSTGATLGMVPFAISLPAVDPPPVNPPPMIVAARRMGMSPHPTTLVLTFSTAMNAASVQNVNNYDLRTANGRLDPIAMATYNSSTNSVTLRTKLQVIFNRYYKLEIKAQGSTGVKSKAGVALDGMKTGHPGNDYFAKVYHYSITPSLP